MLLELFMWTPTKTAWTLVAMPLLFACSHQAFAQGVPQTVEIDASPIVQGLSWSEAEQDFYAEIQIELTWIDLLFPIHSYGCSYNGTALEMTTSWFTKPALFKFEANRPGEYSIDCYGYWGLTRDEKALDVFVIGGPLRHEVDWQPGVQSTNIPKSMELAGREQRRFFSAGLEFDGPHILHVFGWDIHPTEPVFLVPTDFNQEDQYPSRGKVSPFYPQPEGTFVEYNATGPVELRTRDNSAYVLGTATLETGSVTVRGTFSHVLDPSLNYGCTSDLGVLDPSTDIDENYFKFYVFEVGSVIHFKNNVEQEHKVHSIPGDSNGAGLYSYAVKNNYQFRTGGPAAPWIFVAEVFPSYENGVFDQAFLHALNESWSYLRYLEPLLPTSPGLSAETHDGKWTTINGPGGSPHYVVGALGNSNGHLTDDTNWIELRHPWQYSQSPHQPYVENSPIPNLEHLGPIFSKPNPRRFLQYLVTGTHSNSEYTNGLIIRRNIIEMWTDRVLISEDK